MRPSIFECIQRKVFANGSPTVYLLIFDDDGGFDIWANGNSNVITALFLKNKISNFHIKLEMKDVSKESGFETGKRRFLI